MTDRGAALRSRFRDGQAPAIAAGLLGPKFSAIACLANTPPTFGSNGDPGGSPADQAFFGRPILPAAQLRTRRGDHA